MLLNELVSNLYYGVDVYVFFDVLEVLEDHSEFILYDVVPAVYYYGDREEFDVCHALVWGKDALPDPQGVKECEVLSVEEGDPPEAVEKRINFEFLHPLPYLRVDDLNITMSTMSI